MTRFARSSGSKASNERVPEEATSWSEMKQQLLEKSNSEVENSKRQEAEQTRAKNYKAFLDSIEDDKIKNAKWADFPEVKTPQKSEGVTVNKTNGTVEAKKSPKGKLKTKKTQNVENESPQNNVQKKRSKGNKKQQSNGELGQSPTESKSDRLEAQSTQNNMEPKQGKKKEKPRNLETEAGESTTDSNKTSDNLVRNGNQDASKKRKFSEGDDSGTSKKKKAKKAKTNAENATEPGSATNTSAKNQKQPADKTKKQKVKQPVKPKKPVEELTEEEKQKIEKKNQKKARQLERKKQYTQTTVKRLDRTGRSEQRYRKQDCMIINGKEVPVAYVDGFPLKKEDAERIHELRKQMIAKGLPRSEIGRSLKLERRKAEKAFTRERKKVCFNCRNSGHNLSECPELNKDLTPSSGTGICFKCGSTEHTHFECKVVKGQEFKFAKCFICQEQGHISRQCPDNARGLYPKGGACRVCGDVTHLKKDCPKFQSQQQQLQASFTVERMDGEENPDNLDGGDGQGVVNAKAQRINKVVKF